MTTIARLATAMQTARDLAREWEAETLAAKKAAYDAPECLPWQGSPAWHDATADHHEARLLAQLLEREHSRLAACVPKEPALSTQY